MEKPRRSTMEEDGNEDGVGRSYDCHYCKRGFTNAQALGGHMNIHRKDKAKAKAKAKPYSPNPNPNTFSSYSSSSTNNYYSPAYLAPPQRNNYHLYGSNNNYYNYPQFSDCNPRTPIHSSSPTASIYFGNENFSVGRSSLFGMYEEPLGANLSLGREEGNKRKENENNYDAIDLELRLGYDH